MHLQMSNFVKVFEQIITKSVCEQSLKLYLVHLQTYQPNKAKYCKTFHNYTIGFQRKLFPIHILHFKYFTDIKNIFEAGLNKNSIW